MGLPVQKPVIGKITHYVGVYRPHWETCHIGVRVSRTRKILVGVGMLLGLFSGFLLGFFSQLDLLVVGGLITLWVACPAEERWKPYFPSHFQCGLEDKGGTIEFEGVVSPCRRYELLGYLRTVEIVRVLRCDRGAYK